LASWRCSRGRPPSPASAATGTGVGTGTGARRGAVVVVAWEADAQGGADQAVGDGCVSLGGQHHEQVSARCSHRTTHRRDEDGDRDKDGEESRILVTKRESVLVMCIWCRGGGSCKNKTQNTMHRTQHTQSKNLYIRCCMYLL
jgi:hypothetical protein